MLSPTKKIYDLNSMAKMITLQWLSVVPAGGHMLDSSRHLHRQALPLADQSLATPTFAVRSVSCNDNPNPDRFREFIDMGEGVTGAHVGSSKWLVIKGNIRITVPFGPISQVQLIMVCVPM